MKPSWKSRKHAWILATGLGLAACAAASGAHAQAVFNAKADPRREIAAALEASRAAGKLVLLDFGANWCLDCVVLEALFEDPEVAPYLAAHFIVVRVDVGQFNRNLDISATYGRPIENGIPAVVVLSSSGAIVATTADGSMENARTMTPRQVLRFLQKCVTPERR